MVFVVCIAHILRVKFRGLLITYSIMGLRFDSGLFLLEFQSEVLFRALRSRNFEAEKVSYHHQLDRGDNGRRLQASHAIAWLHRLWEADNVHCRPSTTTSTEKSYNSSLTTSSTTTQTEQPNPSDPSPPSNSGFYFSAGKNFLSLPIFVLVLPIITMLAD